MKITLLSYGSRGDVQPYVALSLALKARGHQPRLAAPENFKSFIEGFGLNYAPLCGDTREMLENPEVTGHILAGEDLGFFNAVNRRMGPLKDRLADDAYAASEGAELVVSCPLTEFLAQSVAEARNIRCALSFLAPQVPSSSHAMMALPFASFGLPFLNSLSHAVYERVWWNVFDEGINLARGRWGLKPLSSNPSPAFRKNGGLVLHAYSPEVFKRPLDWGANHAITGAWRVSGERGGGDQNDPGFVQWLEDGSPPVYFGFGSMPVPDHEGFMEMAAELCEELGMRALIGAGWTDITMKACDLPDNLAIVEAVDHAWLFPQCAAIAHHGGAGTTHAGLASGAPNLVASFFADQPFWGRQVKRLGVGASMRFQDMAPDTLRRVLLEALDEDVSAKAAELGARMSAENGAESACEAIEAWAKSA